MKVLFYFGHPAQYLFLREAIIRLSNDPDFSNVILIKTKDVLEDLVKNDGLEYRNIQTSMRGDSRSSIIFGFLKRLLKIISILIRNRPNLIVGGDPSLAQAGKLLNIPRLSLTEDDYLVVKALADITFPYTSAILSPVVCSTGKWEYKKVGYHGYMKLAYLHPNIFTPNPDVLSGYGLPKKYALLRLAKLTAYHDVNITGLNENLLDQLIEDISKQGLDILISAEGKISKKYSKYLLNINPSDMHHVLAGASLLLSDSQSMSVEAAMLGTPSIRYSSFAGRISVLEELEKKYHLTFGIPAGEEKALFEKLIELLEIPDLKAEFEKRRQKMLSEKIDVTQFLVWFIGNYPESRQIMKDNPDYQYNFK